MRQSVKELFVLVNFVQVQEITVPENVGYVAELIANYCYKGLCHTISGPTGVNLCMVLYLTLRGMCSCIVVKEL